MDVEEVGGKRGIFFGRFRCKKRSYNRLTPDVRKQLTPAFNFQNRVVLDLVVVNLVVALVVLHWVVVLVVVNHKNLFKSFSLDGG
jgi:hypothetical protein